MMKNLDLVSFKSRPDLIAPPTFAALSSSDPSLHDQIFVAEIDPANKGGEEFCEVYGVSRADGANCVILEARRNEKVWYVATLIPVGMKMDIGGAIRRHVNARKTGVAPLEGVLESTGMEYGSITVIGLPADWTVLVDSRSAEREFLFIGSGKVNSKLRVPGRFFAQEKQFELFQDLGIPRD